MHNIEERVLKVLAAEMGRSNLTLDMELVKDLGMDSIDAQTILIELEDEFGLSLESGNLQGATVDHLVRIVEKQVKDVNHLIEFDG